MPRPSASNDGPVFADERQARIAELVSVRGQRADRGAGGELRCHEPRSARTSSSLQERGLLKRTHGGALAMHPMGTASSRAPGGAPRSKESIAEACLGLLRDGDSVFLDSGTTVEALARKLGARRTAYACRCSRTAWASANALAEVRPSIACSLAGS